jgi:hypothetical protein
MQQLIMAAVVQLPGKVEVTADTFCAYVRIDGFTDILYPCIYRAALCPQMRELTGASRSKNQQW